MIELTLERGNSCARIYSAMATPAKVVLALGISVLLACGGIGGCLFQNEARYQQERKDLLIAAKEVHGMKAADAERALRSMKIMADCDITRRDDAIRIISLHQYGFIGTFAFPAVELKINETGTISDEYVLEFGGGL